MYHKQILEVLLMYLTDSFDNCQVGFRWSSLISTTNSNTESYMRMVCSQVEKLSIMFLYGLGSMFFPWSSLQSFKDVVMRVLADLVLSSSNFLTVLHILRL